MVYHARMRFQWRQVRYHEVCSGICTSVRKPTRVDEVSMQTNISNGIQQATSKAGATMLGAGGAPTGMGRLPWLTLVADQAGTSKLLRDVLVNWLAGLSSSDDMWTSEVDLPLEDHVC